MRLIFIVIPLILILSCDRNDTNEPQVIEIPDPIKWEVYTTDNSRLPDNFVRSLDFDESGLLLLGTSQRGLWSFDEESWLPILNDKNYSIDKVLANESGIFVATNGDGLFIENNGDWTNYNSLLNGFIHDNIFDFDISEDGQILIGTQRGISLLKADEWEILLDTENDDIDILSSNIFSVLFENSERYWAGGVDGLALYTNGIWQEINELPDNTINDISKDSKGVIWIGTRWGLSRIVDNNNIEDIYEVQSNKPFKGVLNIFEASDGKLYCGTKSAGFFTFKAGEIEIFDVSNSKLPSNNIHSVAEDNDGNIWLGTESGLVKFYPEIHEINQ